MDDASSVHTALETGSVAGGGESPPASSLSNTMALVTQVSLLKSKATGAHRRINAVSDAVERLSTKVRTLESETLDALQDVVQDIQVELGMRGDGGGEQPRVPTTQRLDALSEAVAMASATAAAAAAAANQSQEGDVRDAVGALRAALHDTSTDLHTALHDVKTQWAQLLCVQGAHSGVEVRRLQDDVRHVQLQLHKVDSAARSDTVAASHAALEAQQRAEVAEAAAAHAQAGVVSLRQLVHDKTAAVEASVQVAVVQCMAQQVASAASHAAVARAVAATGAAAAAESTPPCSVTLEEWEDMSDRVAENASMWTQLSQAQSDGMRALREDVTVVASEAAQAAAAAASTADSALVAAEAAAPAAWRQYGLLSAELHSTQAQVAVMRAVVLSNAPTVRRAMATASAAHRTAAHASKSVLCARRLMQAAVQSLHLHFLQATRGVARGVLEDTRDTVTAYNRGMKQRLRSAKAASDAAAAAAAAATRKATTAESAVHELSDRVHTLREAWPNAMQEAAQRHIAHEAASGVLAPPSIVTAVAMDAQACSALAAALVPHMPPAQAPGARIVYDAPQWSGAPTPPAAAAPSRVAQAGGGTEAPLLQPSPTTQPCAAASAPGDTRGAHTHHGAASLGAGEGVHCVGSSGVECPSANGPLPCTLVGKVLGEDASAPPKDAAVVGCSGATVAGRSVAAVAASECTVHGGGAGHSAVLAARTCTVSTTHGAAAAVASRSCIVEGDGCSAVAACWDTDVLGKGAAAVGCEHVSLTGDGAVALATKGVAWGGSHGVVLGSSPPAASTVHPVTGRWVRGTSLEAFLSRDEHWGGLTLRLPVPQDVDTPRRPAGGTRVPLGVHAVRLHGRVSGVLFTPLGHSVHIHQDITTDCVRDGGVLQSGQCLPVGGAHVNGQLLLAPRGDGFTVGVAWCTDGNVVSTHGGLHFQGQCWVEGAPRE